MVKTVPEMLRALSPSRYSTAFATSSTPARRRNALRPTTLRRCSSANPCGEADDRGDVDDAAGPLSHHRPRHVFGEHDRREHVHAHEFLDLRIVHRRQHAVGAERSVVDQGIERPELLAQLAHQVGYLLDVAEIEGVELKSALARAPGIGDRGGYLLARSAAPRRLRHSRRRQAAWQWRGRGHGSRR